MDAEAPKPETGQADPDPVGRRRRFLRAWAALPPVTRGILLMFGSTLGFAAMHVLVRYVSADLHAFQIAFFRNLFGLLVFLPLMLSNNFAVLRTGRLGLHGVRALLNVAAMLCFFTALSLSPVAQVTALGFTAPIFAAILGVVWLGERFHIRRWTAIALGFLGTLVILRPGFVAIDLGSLLTLISAGLWAATMIVIKILGRTESSLTITAYMNILLAILSLGPALLFWRMPAAETWVWLAIMGVLGTAAQIALAQSLKEADASIVMPFDFFRLIWAAALGYLLFTEVPDAFVWLGGAIIVLSTSYIAYRESRLRRRRTLDPPSASAAP